MSIRGGILAVAISGEETVAEASNSVSFRAVTPQFFAALGIPLREGRDVGASDTRESPPVAVVSRSFAQRYWPGRSPLGMRFAVGGEERAIVGVVGDVRVRGLEQETEPQVYIPSSQMPDSDFVFYAPRDLAVRSTSSSAALLPAVRRIIRAADPEQPISDVRTMTEIVTGETAPRVTQLRLLGALSVIALLIAGLGIHGLLAFTVARRTQELGVRRALGEQASSIIRRVLREGLALSVTGVGIGVVLAYLLARGMGALLAGIRPEDPAAMASAAALCLVTALVGGIRPAIRAARVDPIAALREE
jgi:predicted lysophospholipase L1 biosynthesis ABC-type transport system permease subunit